MFVQKAAQLLYMYVVSTQHGSVQFITKIAYNSQTTTVHTVTKESGWTIQKCDYTIYGVGTTTRALGGLPYWRKLSGCVKITKEQTWQGSTQLGRGVLRNERGVYTFILKWLVI